MFAKKIIKNRKKKKINKLKQNQINIKISKQKVHHTETCRNLVMKMAWLL